MTPSWPQALFPDGLAGTPRVTLPNGASIRLRAIQPDDARRLLALCRGLSARTLYARFFSVRRLLPEEAHSLANVDYDRRMAIVAEAICVRRVSPMASLASREAAGWMSSSTAWVVP